MIKKLGVVAFFLVVLALTPVCAFSEDAADTVSTIDASVQEKDAAVPVDEEVIPAEEGVGEGVVTGDITALDKTTGSITVKGADNAEKAFSVVDGETILWKGIEDIKLADINKGDKAEVGYYTNDAGNLVASWVDVIVPEQPAAAGTQIAPAAPEATIAPPVTSDKE